MVKNMERPSMRNLTLSPYMSPEDFEVKGEAPQPTNFLLEDPEGYAHPLVIPIPLAVLISLMDGNRTLKEILKEFTETTHESLTMDELKEMVSHLDKLRCLDSPSFANFLKNEKSSYAREKFRPAAMAGGAYPKDAKELRKVLTQALETPRKIALAEEPNQDFASYFPEEIVGAVSTHLDLERGSASYGWTFQAIANHSDADVFVIFGATHNPMREKFAFSSKSFDTPLGVLPVDLEFEQRAVRRFADKYAQLGDSAKNETVDLFGDDFVHRDEHSIEFQTIFLKYLAEKQHREIRIVPILVNSFVPFLAATELDVPAENDVVRLFLETLCELIGADEAAGKGKFFIMASSDFAHVGPMFDSPPKPVDDERLEQIRKDDTELLEQISETDSRTFWMNILKTYNANKVCGVAPIYCTLRLLELLGRANGGRLLSYEQSVDEETHSCVSFASVAFAKARERRIQE